MIVVKDVMKQVTMIVEAIEEWGFFRGAPLSGLRLHKQQRIGGCHAFAFA
jgi:hypothetical protein